VSATVYTKSGSKSSSKYNLPKSVFGQPPKNHELLKLSHLAALGNDRQNLAKTKTRTEVRGGGRKPHPQKGTGRARSGSIRNPIWRGGGIIFGPRGNQNFTLSLNKSSKRIALLQALGLAANSGRVEVIEDINFNGKTSSAAKLLSKLGFSRGLIVVDNLEDKTKRSVRNLAGVDIVSAHQLSSADVLVARQILLTKAAISELEQRLGGKSS
jgi:large subunit ribosomal protein L4